LLPFPPRKSAENLPHENRSLCNLVGLGGAFFSMGRALLPSFFPNSLSFPPVLESSLFFVIKKYDPHLFFVRNLSAFFYGHGSISNFFSSGDRLFSSLFFLDFERCPLALRLFRSCTRRCFFPSIILHEERRFSPSFRASPIPVLGVYPFPLFFFDRPPPSREEVLFFSFRRSWVGVHRVFFLKTPSWAV